MRVLKLDMDRAANVAFDAVEWTEQSQRGSTLILIYGTKRERVSHVGVEEEEEHDNDADKCESSRFTMDPSTEGSGVGGLEALPRAGLAADRNRHSCLDFRARTATPSH